MDTIGAVVALLAIGIVLAVVAQFALAVIDWYGRLTYTTALLVGIFVGYTAAMIGFHFP